MLHNTFHDEFIKFKQDVNDALNNLKIKCQISIENSSNYGGKIEALETERESKMKMKKECSLTKGVLRNFAKCTGKHLRQSLFSNKVVD